MTPMQHHNHEAGQGLPERNEAGQRIASLQERLKTRGFDLQRQPSGALLICKWGHAREFDLAGAESFARKVGAA